MLLTFPCVSDLWGFKRPKKRDEEMNIVKMNSTIDNKDIRGVYYLFKNYMFWQ